jgi:hypothetical protein
MKLSIFLTALAAALTAVQGQQARSGEVLDKARKDALEAEFETTAHWMRLLDATAESLSTTPPTRDPTPWPTPSLTLPPNPTVMPTPVPPTTASPSPVPPTPPPAQLPSPSPAPTPDSAPTPAPTGVCDIDVDINCTALVPGFDSGVACSDIPPIQGEEKVCTCPDCAKELRFVYTANPCGSLGGCIDSPGPSNGTSIQFFPCNSGNVTIAQPVTPGELIEITLGDTCLPTCMDVNINSASNEIVQSFRIDTSCSGGRGLQLKDSFASIDFVGYSCDETDINDCFVDVFYSVEACNEGTADEFLYEFELNLDGAIVNLLSGTPVNLTSGACYIDFVVAVIDRCTAAEYTATITANSTDPETNEPYPCEDSGELTIVIPPTTIPPTPSPTPFPSIPPTPSPTPFPSIPPTPSPTPLPAPSSPAPSSTDCLIDVVIVPECPVVGCEWNRCLERPFRMEFRFVPAPCEATTLRRCATPDDNTCTCERNRTLASDEWAEQKVFCTDDPDGAGVIVPDYRDAAIRPDVQTFWIVATPERDPSVIYFEGPVDFGNAVVPGDNRFNATDPNLERVEANSYLRLYSADPLAGGVQLQEVLFHSSCSQELWLFDIFGSFQLVEFEALLTGVTGSFENVELAFDLNLSIDTLDGSLALEFLSLTLLPAIPGLVPPQVQDFVVDGATIPPPFTADWDISIIPEVDYIVVTTIGGVRPDGVGCFEVGQQPITCPRVIIPGELPPAGRML